MFRIKTDIRQYQCETKEKVEKLIRNWVIRPNDLIYNTEIEDWHPIGTDPTFENLFTILAQDEENTPDTVITHESRVSGTPKTGTPLDARETDVFDHEEIARDLAERDAAKSNETSEEEDKKIELPIAPDGVEPPSKTEEVTMMTERTLDMLMGDDLIGADQEERSTVETVTNTDDENTDVKKRPKSPDSSSDEERESSVIVSDELKEESNATEDAASNDETSNESDTDDSDDSEPETPADTSDDSELEEDSEPTEINDALERIESKVEDASNGDAVDDTEDANGDLETDKESDVDSDTGLADTGSEPSLGRHNLPEELFATNEISSPEILAAMAKRDDLAALKSANKSKISDSDEDEETTENIGPELGSEVSDTINESEASEADEAWEELVEDFDEDASQPEVSDVSEVSEPHDPSQPFVSDGYKIPLPFSVGPTDIDLRRGLRPSKINANRRLSSFPPPKPKTPGEVQHQTFDFTVIPPTDHTIFIVIGIFVVLFLLVITVIAL